MSAANEYPLGGDLTDDRVSGLLRNTLERLSRRTAQNNTYITNINESGPQESFSSPGIGSWAKDPANTGTSSGSNIVRYNWNTSWCCGGGQWHYESTEEPATKTLTSGRYRRLGLQPHTDLDREGIGLISCQSGSTKIHNSIESSFGTITNNGKIKGVITFQLPLNFKGFKPDGIQLDLRPRGTGMGTSGTPTLSLTLTVYKPHCDTLLDIVTTKLHEYIQNTAPTGAEPEGEGIADSIQHDTLGFTAQDLGPLWGPGDTVRIDVQLVHNVSAGLTTMELHTGALKINYK
mgnify:CR=1 FL=1